jgi:hypothetical protein
MGEKSKSSESPPWDARTLYLAAVAISVPGLLLPALGRRGAGDMRSPPNTPLEQRPAFRTMLAIGVGAGWILMGVVGLVRALS